MKVIVHPDYAAWKDEISRIPDCFDSRGETLYQGRNTVKRFRRTDTNWVVKRYKRPNPAQRVAYTFFEPSKADAPLLEQWAGNLPRVCVVAGRLKLEQELALMSHLDVMVSMDSANMHLASLAGTPVVSVWGATHPLAGFLGWRQRTEDCVQADGLDCRPCSVFGNKPCLRGDYACLASLSPELVAAKIERILTKAPRP